MTIDIGWNDHRKQYGVDMQRGGKKKRKWIDVDPKRDEIMVASAGLDRPLLAEGMEGLDGTGYSFKIAPHRQWSLTGGRSCLFGGQPMACIIEKMKVIADGMMK